MLKCFAFGRDRPGESLQEILWKMFQEASHCSQEIDFGLGVFLAVTSWSSVCWRLSVFGRRVLKLIYSRWRISTRSLLDTCRSIGSPWLGKSPWRVGGSMQLSMVESIVTGWMGAGCRSCIGSGAPGVGVMAACTVASCCLRKCSWCRTSCSASSPMLGNSNGETVTAGGPRADPRGGERRGRSCAGEDLAPPRRSMVAFC